MLLLLVCILGGDEMPVTVLVVDADPRSSGDWEALLSDQGYDVIAARTGEAALTLCTSVRPDVVLLCDLLPDMHGLEVCRRLKADPRNRLTPIILHAATRIFPTQRAPLVRAPT